MQFCKNIYCLYLKKIYGKKIVVKVILETVSMTEMTSFTNLREYYVYVATEYSPAQRLRGLEPSSEGVGIS